MTYSTRTLRLDDAGRIVEIRDAAEVLEPVDEHYDVDDVIEELREDGVDLPGGSIAIDHDGVMVAGGALMINPVTDKWRAHLYGDVDPAFRRRGLGRQVSEHLIERAIALRNQVDPTLPIELKMWVSDSRVSEAALATAMGFSPVRWFFRMGRDLSDSADPVDQTPKINGIRIRPYRDDDSEGVRLASNESFADHWGSIAMDRERWQSLVTGVRAFRPELSFVAETLQDAGSGDSSTPTIVGFSVNDVYDSETLAKGFTTGWVNRLGVTKAGRGKGIATALLLTSLRAFQEAGHRDSQLMVDGDSPTGAGRIYERVGYRTLDRTTTYVRDLPPA